MSIEAWVTLPDGVTYLRHLERGEGSPFRRFAVSRTRGADPGIGSLDHHLDADVGALLADGNLVWFKYRGKTMVWVVEERAIVLDEQEHATDWVKVQGRGVKQLLADRIVWPTAFNETLAGLNPAKWGKDNQWRRVVNRAAGEMLWDLIAESNARPGFAQILRGTIESTGADGWTQDLRFDNLLDVVRDVVAAYGDIEMDGLTFSYLADPGRNLRDTVIFEEGADLLSVNRSTSDRETVTWAVAEGVGEGVTAKLAVDADTTSIARRREAYVDAKDAGNLPLVQLRAKAAISENRPTDSLAIEVTEDRCAAFDNFDIWDTVRVIAPSRGIDASLAIVAIYLSEGDDEQVRVDVDVNTPRQEYLVALDEGQRSTKRSLGIRQRQPQGQLTAWAFGSTGVFDTGSPMYCFIKIPDRVYLIIEAKVSLAFRQFAADATAASSGGGSTSGASSATTSGASNTSSSAAGPHSHGIANWTSDTPGAFTSRRWSGIQFDFNLTTSGHAGDVFTTDIEGAGGHDHTIAHNHNIPHTHSVVDHVHGLDYGTFEEAFPASHSVTLRLYLREGGTWTLQTSFTGLTDDLVDVDLTEFMDAPGDWRLTVQSEAAQPQGGRLGCDLYGAVLGAIQSA